MSDSAITSGLPVTGAAATGTLRHITGIARVLELMREGSLEDVILLVDSAAATEVTPLLSKVAGIVCQSGGLTSHLAIVSREFGLPCVMSATIDDPEAVEGRRVVITSEGSVLHA